MILSKDYASSSWCLIELAKIVKCMEKKELIVLPVFHYVDPSDVRNQRGAFAEAFVKHEERFNDNIEDVYTWRAALTQVASIAGWDLHDKQDFISEFHNATYYCFLNIFVRSKFCTFNIV